MRSRKGFTPRYKKVRYSNETTCVNIQSSITQNTTPTLPLIDDKRGFILVNSANLQGTRKAKNFLLSISSFGNTVPLLCAVVYVPQGTDPSTITPSVPEFGSTGFITNCIITF